MLNPILLEKGIRSVAGGRGRAAVSSVGPAQGLFSGLLSP
jgi:hypothetical protein